MVQNHYIPFCIKIAGKYSVRKNNLNKELRRHRYFVIVYLLRR